MSFVPHFEAALEKRVGLPNAQTNLYRAFNGNEEGVPGLVLDIYNRAAVMHGEYSPEHAAWWKEKLLLEAVYAKPAPADRSQGQPPAELYAAAPLAGDPMPESFLVRENGMNLEVRLYDGYSTGIFLDQRENRRFLATRKAKRVLNGFSYTCAFSVACAKAGSEVTSVDISKKVLEWGKRNFTANGLALDGHRFFAEDVRWFLDRAVKRGESYDLIILDPPSFARTERGTFSVEKDFEELIDRSLRLLGKGGELFFSSNLSTWNSDKTLCRARYLAQDQKKRVVSIQLPPPPRDFALEVNQLTQFLMRIEA